MLSDDTGISIKTVKNNLTQLKRAGLAYEVGKDGHATVYAPLEMRQRPNVPLYIGAGRWDVGTLGYAPGERRLRI